MSHDLLFIAGAPGVGKSTVAKIIQHKLRTPLFEFGWIPEFRKKDGEEIPYEEEEGIAFENLSLSCSIIISNMVLRRSLSPI